ncbi:MAG: AbrB/MazE/SpoVT family DNA-binding domain-containing protein [Chloroflexota bacterium]
MLAKKTSKNQITLPKDIAKNFPDTIYFDVAMNDNQILLRPVKVSPSESGLEKVRLKMKKLGITEKDVEEAIAWARKSVK